MKIICSAGPLDVPPAGTEQAGGPAAVPAPPPPAAAAQQRALAVAELLEAILAQVDMRTLLVAAQRVCWQWRNLVRESPTLQQRLFFQPALDHPHRPRGSSTYADVRPLLNPLLVSSFPAWFRDGPPRDPLEERAKPARLSAGKVNAFMRRGASWRHMLVMQPAVFRLGTFLAVSNWDLPVGALHDCRLARFTTGLRMGYIYDAVVHTHDFDVAMVWDRTTLDGCVGWGLDGWPGGGGRGIAAARQRYTEEADVWLFLCRDDMAREYAIYKASVARGWPFYGRSHYAPIYAHASPYGGPYRCPPDIHEKFKKPAYAQWRHPDHGNCYASEEWRWSNGTRLVPFQVTFIPPWSKTP